MLVIAGDSYEQENTEILHLQRTKPCFGSCGSVTSALARKTSIGWHFVMAGKQVIRAVITRNAGKSHLAVCLGTN